MQANSKPAPPASESALAKTFELVASKGPAQKDLEPLFKALDADVEGTLDGVQDQANQPLDKEPQKVRDDLRAVSGARQMKQLLTMKRPE